jgi:hypothetical protein
MIDKKDIKLKFIKKKKILNLNNYDKRIFKKNKKETTPLYTEDGIEYTST